MTVMEIANVYHLQPKDVIDFLNANATFPITRNYRTGEIIIPDDVDIKSFFAPLVNKELAEQIEKEKRENEARRVQRELMAVEAKIQQANCERQEFENENSVAIASLKKMGAEGYYQYKVISLLDVGGLFKSNSGRVNTEAMTKTLNELGIDGWHLVTAYSNELGKNALSGGAGGVLLGVNSTVDENILIFERFVKI